MSRIHGGNVYEIARAFGRKPEEIIDFSASVNPLGFSKKAERKIVKELPAIRHYPDPSSLAVTEALARFHTLDGGQILFGAGSTEFIQATPWVLKIRRALIVTPAFSEYETALENVSGGAAEIHYFETREEDGFELNVEGLLLCMTRGYDALYLANPNNPTGILTEKDELRRILDQAERQGIWFILDEAFIDFVEGSSLVGETASSSRLLVLRTMANFFGFPGLRAGYMVSHPEVIRSFSEKRGPWSVNTLAQIAASESLQDRAFLQRTQELIRRERDRLIRGLQSIPGFIPYPGAANYLLVQLHPSLDLSAAELRDRLLESGILIRDCGSFHHLGPFFFRISVRTRKENSMLLKALMEITHEIHSDNRKDDSPIPLPKKT